MFLTSEILKKKKACNYGLQWFERAFPDGAELMDILEEASHHLSNRKVLEMLYWGYTHLEYDERELEKMREVLSIDTSTEVWMSGSVFESHKVARSCEIYRSQNVESSYNIEDSVSIYNSKEVKKSQFVFGSEDVCDSSYILSSNRIQDCADVYKGADCLDSSHLYAVSDCYASTRLSFSDGIAMSSYSTNLHDCSYCLFCKDLYNKRFYIFNEKVSERDYFVREALIKKYLTELEREQYMIKQIYNEKAYAGVELLAVPNPYCSYDRWSKDTFARLRKIPGYNDWLMYQITMNQNSFFLDD